MGMSARVEFRRRDKALRTLCAGDPPALHIIDVFLLQQILISSLSSLAVNYSFKLRLLNYSLKLRCVGAERHLKQHDHNMQ